MSVYNFKKIQVVPTANEFIDIILSKTQKKTPTVVHPNYQIGRIRQFYMRKVKFAHEAFNERLENVISDFPKLDEVHPFYADLLNVLYDRDHYKLALGQLNTAKHLVEQVSKDYIRLLKFGDSLYRCKQLKRAALGRMATIMKRQKDALAYLEQVRQHLARLPSIDPNTRTLLVCGYPNVGKSSFINKVTRAEVEVQPYAFTTKSLFVGHMDYKYLRWQCIDTPGILDHPLEDRNTIEMQSITALAHLRACVMFFVDLSEQCGYSVKEQLALYESLKPLFVNKPTLLVINKIDMVKPEQLAEREASLLKDVLEQDNLKMVTMSCFTDEGVMDVRNNACDMLLQSRVESKLKGQKIHSVLNKLHVAQPVPRDNKERVACIPAGALNRVKYDKNDPGRIKLERDIEVENGGAGVYNVDLRKRYMLEKPEWKYDILPEVMDGKNVADFIDPEIDARLSQLELEEAELEARGFYNSESEGELTPEQQALVEASKHISDKKSILMQIHRSKKGSNNRSTIPKKQALSIRPASELVDQAKSRGQTASLESVQGRIGRKRSRSESRSAPTRGLSTDGRSSSRAPSTFREGASAGIISTLSSRSKSVARDRSELGIRDKKQKLESETIKKKQQRQSNLMAKRGEADREITIKRQKHLFTGKRGVGKTDRR